ncbi:MAG: hypothetical protein G01um101425_416 [Candidatus Peregrinibacteria bacterium Gr01-1014_25]|nr:MAG: hypothetical protein G01um101425_416 [Candidatus Peregrinibacteria bacterium Gr01-1014_25]
MAKKKTKKAAKKKAMKRKKVAKKKVARKPKKVMKKAKKVMKKKKKASKARKPMKKAAKVVKVAPKKQAPAKRKAVVLKSVKKGSRPQSSAATFTRLFQNVAPGKPLPIGVVTHYYDRIGVAVLKLREPLSKGDKIRMERGEDAFTQTIDSMQVNRMPVHKVAAGADVAIKVAKPAHEGTRLYRA